jgi:hypothetical protein
MLYLPVYLLYLLLPGYVATRLLALRGPVFVYSFALSFALIVLTATLLRMADPGFGALSAAVHAETIGLLVLAWWRGTPLLNLSRVDRGLRRYGVGIAVLAASGAYLAWAGPYLELPADAWHHLAELNQQLAVLGGDVNAGPLDLRRALQHGTPVDYAAAAFVLSVIGLKPYQALNTMGLTHALVFLGAVFSFALYLFAAKRIDARAKVMVAALSSVFFLVHFGVGVFDYVRYYSFAPAMPTFIIYLAAVALLVRIIERGAPLRREGTLLVLLIAAAAISHRQEALFIAVMAGAMLIAAVFLRAGRWAGARAAGGAGHTWQAGGRNAWLLAAWIAGYAAIHGLALSRLHPNVDLGGIVVLPWSQYYAVVTPWGMAVTVLFLLYWREFRDSAYLVGAMIAPLLTVFNPLFVDLFLRVSWPEVAWRLLFVLPLPFVAGYVAVDLFRRLRAGGSRLPRVLAGAALAALALLWLPLGSLFPGPSVSRLTTLAPVDPGNDYRMWGDLWRHLRNYRDRFILTDPVTGYAANALTDNRNRGFKFYASEQRFRLDKAVYSRSDFLHMGRWLLVINKRSGRDSVNGRLSGHWPADVMDLEQYYSPELERFVADNPDLFVEVWSQDRISVYEIRAS